ncbi:serine hydrolase domain-containing protein [Aquiflexum sp.]|uniref:serine hydrolase domain-containing protein n=1 Tax=Aquiflexum sp. TaxID=1872584 RepID=UPI003593E006
MIRKGKYCMGFKSYSIAVMIALLGCSNDLERIDTSISSELDNVILSEFKRMQLPGMAVAAVNEEGLASIKGYGYANVESGIPFTSQTRIQIASVSKLIVSIAIIQMVESGLVELQSDVNQYLPFYLYNPSFPNEPITLKMLLTHSSSIIDAGFLFKNFNVYSNQDFPLPLNVFLENYLSTKGKYFTIHNYSNHKPGEQWLYSNIGTSLAALIVQEVIGMDFNEYCKAHIFIPLEMHHTTWRYDETSMENLAIPYAGSSRKTPKYPHKTYPDYPSGHLISTADDLAKFLFMLINGGETQDGEFIINQTSLNLMMEVHRTDLRLPNPPQAIYNFGPDLSDQGLLFFKGELGDYKLWGHTGDDAGVSTELYVDIENKIGYLMLNNRSWAHSPIIGKALLDYAIKN